MPMAKTGHNLPTMTTTEDPDQFRRRWHNHLEEVQKLKMTLHPDDFEEVDEALETLHDLVDDAADELGDDE